MPQRCASLDVAKADPAPAATLSEELLAIKLVAPWSVQAQFKATEAQVNRAVGAGRPPGTQTGFHVVRAPHGGCSRRCQSLGDMSDAGALFGHDLRPDRAASHCCGATKPALNGLPTRKARLRPKPSSRPASSSSAMARNGAHTGVAQPWTPAQYTYKCASTCRAIRRRYAWHVRPRLDC